MSEEAGGEAMTIRKWDDGNSTWEVTDNNNIWAMTVGAGGPGWGEGREEEEGLG